MGELDHEIKKITLVWWVCSCGADWRNHKLHAKSDEELACEAQSEFEKHRAVFDKKKK